MSKPAKAGFDPAHEVWGVKTPLSTLQPILRGGLRGTENVRYTGPMMQSTSPALAPSMLALTNGEAVETAMMLDTLDAEGIDRLAEDEMPAEAYGMTLPGHPEQYSPWADLDYCEDIADFRRFLD